MHAEKQMGSVCSEKKNYGDPKEIYWEHEGMMDKSDYAKTAVKKLESYQKNGIYLGERLIATFETEQTLLNSQIIEQLVKKYLL